MKAMNDSGTKLSKSAKGVNTALSGVGRSAGMAGIQVQQFVGQIQGGQSAMVALSQQGADLGFVLGAPLLGAVVGITASVVGMAFAFSGVNVELKETAETVPQLVKRFNELDDAAKSLALGVVAAEIIAQEKALKDTEAALLDYRTSLNLFSSTEEVSAKVSQYTGTIQALELALSDLKTTYKDLSPSGSVLSAVMAGIEAQNAELLNQANVVDELVTTNILLANTYGMSALQVQLYKAELVGANDAQKDAIRLSFELAEAKRAEVLANKELFNIASMQTEGDPALVNSKLLHEQRLRDEQTFQEMIAEIKFTGQESVEELYAKELFIHQSMLNSKLISEEDFAKAQLKLAKQYSSTKDNELKADKKINKQKISDQQNYVSIAGSLSTLMFNDDKDAASATAFINTAVGVTAALSKQDYAGAVAIGLAGAVQIASINSTSKGSSGASVTTPNAPAQQNFEPETAGLEVTESTSTGSTTSDVRLGTNTPDDIIEQIAEALNVIQSRS